MVAYPKKIADEEMVRYPPFNVSCPYCGAAPGFHCRKQPSGQRYYGTHRARHEASGAAARMDPRNAGARLDSSGRRIM
jgi:hypothetical protein